MAWIELHQTLPTHRKIKKLKRVLKIKTPQAVGHVVMLWLWSIDNAPDGDLSKVDAEDIAEACEWPKDAGDFVAAMQEAGFIDPDMRLHDWSEYTGRLMGQRDEKRRKDRERQARYRAKKADAANDDKVVSNNNVTRDKCVSHADITPLQNSTVQNSTVISTSPPSARAGNDPIETTEEGEPQQPSKAMRAAMAVMQPEPDPQVDPGLGRVMSFYMNRINPTPSQRSIEELGAYAEAMDADVIIQAMTYAMDEHKATWSYIRATLRAYQQRGIRTMADLQRANDEFEKSKQRREDTHNASTRRNSKGQQAGGTPPDDADPLRGFHTEP